MKQLQFFLLSLLISTCLEAQVNVRDSTARGVLFAIGASFQQPDGDLAEKFGFSVDLSFDVWYKTRSHWLFGGGGSFFFGDDVRIGDQLVSGLVTSTNQMLNLGGSYGDYKFFERGFSVQAEVGKIFPAFGHNANSGPVIILGGGYIQHRVRIENAGQDIPQLLNEYQRGYDRLSGGPMLRQFVGYFHAGGRRRINFLIGFDFIQAFTQDFRGYHYDTGEKVEDIQRDFLYGVRFIWFLPVYRGAPETYFYR